MKRYRISEIAQLAGLSVRTLHHYDHLELLVPTSRTAEGYREYGDEDLLRLQQILFFRELGMPLAEIRRTLDTPEFDTVQSLRRHRAVIEERIGRMAAAIDTIDKTIRRIQGDESMVSDDELYAGISPETRERWDREVDEQYDSEIVAESRRRVRKMSKEQWKRVRAEEEAVARALAELAGDHEPTDPQVQALIERHHAWIGSFYDPTAKIYAGLADLYAENPEFRAYYDRFGEGLADFMKPAMQHFARTRLQS